MAGLGWRMWERFAAGDSIIYDGIGLRIDIDGTFVCTVASTCSIEKVTLHTACADLSRAEQVVSQLNTHPAFSALTAGRAVRKVLVCDSANGPLTLCTRTNCDDLVWSLAYRDIDEGSLTIERSALA